MMVVDTIPGQYLLISGTLTTTNIIMANWSRHMWQSVVSRVAPAMPSEQFRSHVFSKCSGNRKRRQLDGDKSGLYG
ncbi:hypothetical protein KIN20_035278 [Parelaphostrongylus tenuis]|uniref:Uncharacterized protein n=1 Tax=Parelaphostrongylus tenuis TaxID=148309 RepID=A0AAD5RAW6_PARTN|nr:hypothetical protein KIN20_035278 [Parelaphostrongylus tenuis]